MRNYEGKQRKIWPKWQKKKGRGGRNIASESFRQLPRTSVDIRAMRGRKTEAGRCEIMRENREIGLAGRNQGGAVEILLPSASVSFRSRPRHVWPEDGRRSYYRKLPCLEMGSFRKNGRNVTAGEFPPLTATRPGRRIPPVGSSKSQRMAAVCQIAPHPSRRRCEKGPSARKKRRDLANDRPP